jgi:hypothetical protein
MMGPDLVARIRAEELKLEELKPAPPTADSRERLVTVDGNPGDLGPSTAVKPQP